MSILVGDASGNGTVNSSDVSQVKLQSGQLITSSNFRADISGNGAITSTDVSIVKSRTGTALPSN
jgi:dockerin type I repeat protein